MHNSNLFYYFFKRELRSKYLGNITGISWVFIQPVITLLIYWFVFGVIFNNRIPEAENISFIVYLAIGFWPWQAFSESLLRSITAVSDNNDLIGKISIDFRIPVIASISASFFLNILGYIIVIIGLVLFAERFNYSSIPLIILPIAQLYCLAIALGLFLSAIQIFIRDTLQIVTTLITMWFFLTPIIYSESILPEKYKAIIQLNPVYTPISFIHRALITNQPLPWVNMLILSIVIVISLIFALKAFNKLAPSFEDFK